MKQTSATAAKHEQLCQLIFVPYVHRGYKSGDVTVISINIGVLPYRDGKAKNGRVPYSLRPTS